MLYFLVFFTALSCGFFSLVRDQKNIVILSRPLFAVLFLFLFLFAGLRAPDMAPDYLNYISWLYRVGTSPESIFEEFKDPGFLLTFSFIHWLGLPDYVFFSFVSLISLYAKSIFSNIALRGCFSYLLFFMIFSRFYIVQDMVQVRVGVAIALASCGMMFFYTGQKTKGLIYYFLALSFHLSVITFLPCFALVMLGFRFVGRVSIVVLLGLAFALSTLISGFADRLSGFSRLAPYINGEYHTSALSLFSFYFITRMTLVTGILIVLYQRLTEAERFILSLSAIGLALQISLSWNDSFSLRAAEIFGFFDMACFVMLMRLFDYRSRFLYGLMLVGMAAVFYVSSLKMVEDYRSVFS
ncbi:EpsG family protein [Pseudomonas sp. RGB]|uniref:EpsG family protein n=1 Tax=unclassified Pseudomonas TaxID=196821 RepID=UPI001190D248|nr:EpsG family protein [Pseudomonas sp. RGB]TVT90124.1 EpsG family protein [Pseudomonas sp. RGB]